MMLRKYLNKIFIIIIMMFPLTSWSEDCEVFDDSNNDCIDDGFSADIMNGTLIVTGLDLSVSIISVDTLDGIWKRRDLPHYYTVYQQDGKIVVINLHRLERSGNSLTAAYTGDIDGELFPMASFQENPQGDFPITFVLRSETLAIISPAPSACSTNCNPFSFFLDKVFK